MLSFRTIVFLVVATVVTSAVGASEDGSLFANRVYPILQKAGCRACHIDDGVASATRLHFPPDSATREEIEAFGYKLGTVVDWDNPERSLLLLKPTNRVPHTGGERISPASEQETVLRQWVTYLVSRGSEAAVERGSEPAEISERTETVVRRLTHSQYNNTVRDLLGDQTRPAAHFPPEDFVNAFKNQARAQSISPLLAEAYSKAAEKLARNAFRFGDKNGLVPCEPEGLSDTACAEQFVERFGLEAYRRPLTHEERQDFISVFVKRSQETGEFLAGAQIVVEVMLQSPNFLFLVERGSEGGWDQYELATRLSYFLWNTMPDARLFELAAEGRLGQPEEIEDEARRMLADSRSLEALDEFVSQWLRFDRVLESVKDSRLYPDFTPLLAFQMTEESKRLVRYLFENDKHFMDFFTARYGFVTAELAGLYGVPSPSQGYERVSFPQGIDRAGIIGQGTFLAQTAKPDTTSPTERGLFVREHFLCQHVPSPPPGVNANLPPITSESKPMTNRDRMAELHMTDETCASCHRLIDPIGFGLENFDSIGRWHAVQLFTVFPTEEQRRDGAKPKVYDLNLDTSASIAGIPDSDFSSAIELGKVLAGSRTCQECIVKQLFRYALGRGEDLTDRDSLDAVFTAFKKSGFQLRELLVALVKSESFRKSGGG